MPVHGEAIVEHPSDAEAIPSAEASDGLGEASAHVMATGPGIPQATYGPTHSGNVARFSSGTAGSSGTGSSVHVDHTIGHDSYECNHVNGVTFPPRVSSSAGAGEVRPIYSVSGGHSFGGNLLGSPAALGGQLCRSQFCMQFRLRRVAALPMKCRGSADCLLQLG